MRHLFLINPASIKNKKKRNLLLTQIKEKCNGLEYEIYLSQSIEDAQQKAVSAAKKGEEICIYVGGGDGSIHQITKVIYSYSNVILSVIPIGTGNDFIRTFSSKKDFMSLDHIKQGEIKTIDLLQVGDSICTNMINIGFDESVVRKVNELKRFPLMSSSIAYTIGVMIQLIRFPNESLHIRFDDGSEYNGKCLLNYIANGQYCGGGYRAASLASPDDGKADVLIVYPVSRLTFLSLVGYYKKGTLLNSPKLKKIGQFCQVKHITISKEDPFHVCLDGEIILSNHLEIQVLPKALRFKYPKINKI